MGSTTTTTTTASEPPPAPQGANDVMRVGDKFIIRLTGVPDEEPVEEKQIPASGDITVDYLSQSFHAAGRSATDVAAEIAAAYRDGKIYTNPNVTIIPEERYISVGGDVRLPNRVIYSPDLTLLGAINSCGGFTEYANRKAVRIKRGKDTFQVDCVAAQKGGDNPAVYPGDEIYVPRTVL
jgi:polysaccharide export outer membrane protein